jgi:Glu-tRNA(Gln) amidotransferase subunit E-like FAD-binding protein
MENIPVWLIPIILGILFGIFKLFSKKNMPEKDIPELEITEKAMPEKDTPELEITERVMPEKDIQQHDIPDDINKRIRELFPDEKTNKEVLKLINDKVYNATLNVGPDQLTRSILIIAESDKNKIEEIIKSHFYGDPRDVIMMAMRQPGNNNNHGLTPFD